MSYFLFYMLIGASAGILSGMFGLGGGIIIIPLLVLAFKLQHMSVDLIMHMAAGTSLAVMVFSTSSALYGHTRRKVQVWPVYRRLFMGLIIGTIVGAMLSHLLHSNILEIIFGVFVLLVAMQMLVGRRPKPSRKLPQPLTTSAITFLIGGKSGLLGIGGGAIMIPFLHYCNVPIRNIVAITSACSLTIAIVGSISFMLMGYVYWPAFLGIILTGPLCAQLGAIFSHKLPTKTLKKTLAIVLLLIAIKMLV